LERQAELEANLLAAWSEGINMAINMAMMAITTSSSINVKPLGLHMIRSSPFLLE
jgi:hypothetical protein